MEIVEAIHSTPWSTATPGCDQDLRLVHNSMSSNVEIHDIHVLVASVHGFLIMP